MPETCTVSSLSPQSTEPHGARAHLSQLASSYYNTKLQYCGVHSTQQQGPAHTSNSTGPTCDLKFDKGAFDGARADSTGI